MDEVVASNVFTTTSGSFIGAKEARVVERNVDEYEMNESNKAEAIP